MTIVKYVKEVKVLIFNMKLCVKYVNEVNVMYSLARHYFLLFRLLSNAVYAGIITSSLGVILGG